MHFNFFTLDLVELAKHDNKLKYTKYIKPAQLVLLHIVAAVQLPTKCTV